MAEFNLFDPTLAPKGVATLVKTPLLDNGRVDFDSYTRQVEHVVDVGTCLAIPGMRGSETFTLSEAERFRCLQITLDICADKVPVCAAVVGLSVPEAVGAAQRAEAMGADVVALVLPPWVRNEADFAMCVKAVADAVSVPNLVHSVGGAGDIAMSIPRLAQLPAEAPNVLYLKEEAPFAVRRVSQILDYPGGDSYLRIMVGPPLVLGYLAGARLFMASADTIEPFVAVFEALEAGDLVEARRIDAHIHALNCFRGYIKGQFNNKMIMHRRGLFDSARCASPRSEVGLTDLTEAEEDELTYLLQPLMPFYTKYPPKPPARIQECRV